jgi:hypothetical protein
MARLVAILAGLLFLPFLAAPAAANTIATFSVDVSLFTGPVPDKDGTATGTFSLDLTTQKLVAAAITTTTGAFVLGTSYPGFSADAYTFTSTGAQLVFRNSATAVPGVAGQLLTLDIPGFNPAFLSITDTFFANGNESVYFVLCGGLCASRAVFGIIQPTSLIATTPVPATLPLLATALGGIGILGWRRRHAAVG